MFRLTARYADRWNAAWFGLPENYSAKVAQLVAGCHAEGRDPTTIAATIGMIVLHPELVSATMRDTPQLP